MPSVFDYLDYRTFLAAWYKETKESRKSLSYRFIAQKVGFSSPGFFTQILQSRTNISLETATGFADLIGLKARARDYFLTLVSHNQAKDPEAARRSGAKLKRFLEFRVRELKSEQEKFLDSWHHAAIRELLGARPFRDNAEEFANLLDPSITPAEATESVNLLVSLGLAARTSRGVERRDQALTAGSSFPPEATNRFFRNLHDLGIRAMDRFPRDRRNLSWVTFSASEAAYREILEEARSFRRKVLEIASRDLKAKGVHQLTLMIHPLSKDLSEGGAG